MKLWTNLDRPCRQTWSTRAREERTRACMNAIVQTRQHTRSPEQQVSEAMYPRLSLRLCQRNLEINRGRLCVVCVCASRRASRLCVPGLGVCVCAGGVVCGCGSRWTSRLCVFPPGCACLCGWCVSVCVYAGDTASIYDSGRLSSRVDQVSLEINRGRTCILA